MGNKKHHAGNNINSVISAWLRRNKIGDDKSQWAGKK